MANGWTSDGNVQAQIDSTVEDAVARARAQLAASGPSATHCEDCGDAIPERRRELLPGVRLCVQCQSTADRQQQVHSGFNRRGSKDSQLR